MKYLHFHEQFQSVSPSLLQQLQGHRPGVGQSAAAHGGAVGEASETEKEWKLVVGISRFFLAIMYCI